MAKDGIIIARVDHDAVRHLLHLFTLFLGKRAGIPHQTLGLPGLHPLQLFRKSLGIGGSGERFPAEDRGDLMLAMAIARCAAESKDDHVGTKAADHPNHVAQDFLAAPLLEGLFGSFGESEVDGAGKELLGSVNAPGSQQLLGPDDAQCVALLGADQILPAFAAGERQISGPHFAPTRQIGEQRGVLVVRVGRDHQHAPHHVQTVERKTGFGRSRHLALRKGRSKTRADENG